MARSRIDRAILIAGPTAGGKSDVAMALARELGGAVVNADSMQVYRDLRILTARPDAKAEAAVPHRLFGHVDAADRYSAGRWLGEARCALGALAADGRTAIIAGGTGLYFKVLTEGLADIPPVDARIERHWQARLAAEGAGALHEELRRVDPAGAAAIPASDGQRLVRALTVLAATGMPLRSFHDCARAPLPADASVRRLVVMPQRQALYRNIEARFDAMVVKGALGEVTALLARRLDLHLPAMKAIGVKELAGHLAGTLSLDAAMAQAKTRSRRYAKRQMTWIRGQMADWPVAPGPEEAIAMARRMIA